VEGDESLQYDELVAEVEQRVTQLESVDGRYNSRFNSALLQPEKRKKPIKSQYNPETLKTFILGSSRFSGKSLPENLRPANLHPESPHHKE
jgi:hypothetical protein